MKWKLKLEMWSLIKCSSKFKENIKRLVLLGEIKGKSHLNYFDFFPSAILGRLFSDRSKLLSEARSWNIVGCSDEIWFLDKFNTMRLVRPWKDFLDRHVSHWVWSRLCERSSTTRLCSGWNNLLETTDNSFWSSLSCCSPGTLWNSDEGSATILLPEIWQIF